MVMTLETGTPPTEDLDKGNFAGHIVEQQQLLRRLVAVVELAVVGNVEIR